MNISTTQTFQKILLMLQTLENQGVKFVVETPDGNKFQSKQPVGGPVRARKIIDRNGVHLADLFKDRLDNMKPGDFLVFEMPQDVPNVNFDNWRNAVSARCVHIFGTKNYMTSSNSETGAVEVLRVA